MPTKPKQPPAHRRRLRASALAPGSAPAWEYMSEICKGGYISRQRLAELGSDGWEMCGTVATTEPPSDMSSLWPGMVCFYFKRALPNSVYAKNGG